MKDPGPAAKRRTPCSPSFARRKSLSKSLRGADAELRRALRRSLRQKATIRSLSRENARLRKRAKASRNRIETLEVQLARLRATGAVLSRALFGARARSRRRRAPGVRAASSAAPPAIAVPNGPGSRSAPKSSNRRRRRVCAPVAGKAYVANGVDESTLVEIEVKAYKRVIRRPRWRRAAAARPSPIEVSAPQRRGCSPERSTGPASGRASCSNTAPASAPCTGLPRGCPARGCRARRGRWPTA